MSKDVLQEVLDKQAVNTLWGAGYRPALPITPQDFAIGNVIPAMLFMMRWGKRRGSGKFFETFFKPDNPQMQRNEKRRGRSAAKFVSIADVADQLRSDTSAFKGFEQESGEMILGDLLLAFSLENSNHQPGRDKKVQRIYPTHYFSSWVDLPDKVANLRYVPEFLVALLQHSCASDNSQNSSTVSAYRDTGSFSENPVLRVFSQGMRSTKRSDNVRSDTFDEVTEVGVDQLLAIRIANAVGEPPLTMKGQDPDIPRELGIACEAAERFTKDLRVLFEQYSNSIPRQAFIPMLDSLVSVGFTTYYLSTFNALLQWSASGKVTEYEILPYPLFVDCSASSDNQLRTLSEQTFDELLRVHERMPIISMCLRVLDWKATEEGVSLESAEPFGVCRLEQLGNLLLSDSEDATFIKRDLKKLCNKLSTQLEKNEEMEIAQALKCEELHPAWRLAEAIVALMDFRSQSDNFRAVITSSMMVDSPYGIAKKRKVIRKNKMMDKCSIVLSNSCIDVLAHRYLVSDDGTEKICNLSFSGFIEILRDNYGFYIDQSPPGFSFPQESLTENRKQFERKLRDLGLLTGVNDAESMKRIKPRFIAIRGK